MRPILMVCLLSQAACWSERSFIDACVDAGHCHFDDAGVTGGGSGATGGGGGATGGGGGGDAGGFDDDGGVATWAEVKAALFAVSGLDAGFQLEFVNTGVTGHGWIGGVLTRTGSVLCMPFQGNLLLEITPSHQVSTRQVPSPLGGWEGGVLLADGTVLGLPYNAGAFLAVPPDGGAPRLVDAGLAETGLSTPWYEGGVVTRSGKVLLAPSSGTFPGVFDPTTGVLTLLDAGVVNDGGSFQYAGAVLLADGESALLTPIHASTLILVTPTSARALTSLTGVAGGVLLPSDEAMLMPSSGNFWDVNVAMPTPVAVGPVTSCYFSGAWSTNGYAYAVQTDDYAGHLGLIDGAGNASEWPLSSSEIVPGSHYGFVAMSDGTIVGCPHQSEKVLFLVPNERRTVSVRVMTSPWLNKW